jgi:hypothetical protein
MLSYPKSIEALNRQSIKADQSITQSIRPNKPVGGDAFQSGNIEITLDIPANAYLDPAQSYLSIRVSLTKTGAALLTDGDNIAPAFNSGAALFSNAALELNGTRISEVNSNLARMDSLVNLTTCSEVSRANSGMKELAFFDPSFANRKAALVAGRAVKEYDIYWSMKCLSAFGGNGEKCLPSGQYTLILSPQQGDLLNHAIEKPAAAAVNGLAFSVVDISWNVCLQYGEKISDGEHFIGLEEITPYARGIISNSYESQNLTVSPHTKQLTVFFADKRQTTSKFSHGLFKCFDDASPAAEVSQTLKRLSLVYGGKSYPPSKDSIDIVAGRDYDMSRRYLQTAKSLNADLCHGSGFLPYNQWLQSPFYTTNLDKNPEDGSPQLEVSYQLGGGSVNHEVVVCSHHSSYLRLTYSNGLLVDVVKAPRY